MDQRGPMCYDCGHVSMPEECLDVTLCGQDEMCYIEAVHWGEASHYKLGCTSTGVSRTFFNFFEHVYQILLRQIHLKPFKRIAYDL